MAQRTGALVFDENTDRFDLASYYGGLHCGECFDVFVRGKWKRSRLLLLQKRCYLLQRQAGACLRCIGPMDMPHPKCSL